MRISKTVFLICWSFVALTLGYGAAFLFVDKSSNLIAGVGDVYYPIQFYKTADISSPSPIVAMADDVFSKNKNQKHLTSLLFAGDIMLDRGVEKMLAEHGEYDYQFPFLFVEDILQNADITFGNLEGPISDKGKDTGKIYSFRMDPAAVPILKEVGFDVLSFANNHAGDWGREAFQDTLRRLRAEGIQYTGAGVNKKEAMTPVIIEKNGLKIGFLGFSDVGPNWLAATDTAPGILLAGGDFFTQIIRQARDAVDILIVSFHFGEEYETVSIERQQLLARSAIDAGADIIIGHHPHVIEEIERYNNGIIAYSLGNFIFDQRFSDETSKGLLLEILLDSNTIDQVIPHRVFFNKYFQPIIKEQNGILKS